MFLFTKLEKKVEKVLPVSEGVEGRCQKHMYVSKCKNDKIKERKKLLPSVHVQNPHLVPVVCI
jgi:hypothetical protein